MLGEDGNHQLVQPFTRVGSKEEVPEGTLNCARGLGGPLMSETSWHQRARLLLARIHVSSLESAGLENGY